MKNIIWEIKRFFKRITNVLSWIPILWSVQWYEYDNFYVIVRFTLVKMIKHFKSFHVQYIGIERDIELMELCIRLIDRVKDDYYTDKLIDEISEKYGDLKMTTTPSDSELFYIADFTYEKIIISEEVDEEDRRQIRKKWEARGDKARALLFRILNERLHRWWI